MRGTRTLSLSLLALLPLSAFLHTPARAGEAAAAVPPLKATVAAAPPLDRAALEKRRAELTAQLTQALAQQAQLAASVEQLRGGVAVLNEALGGTP